MVDPRSALVIAILLTAFECALEQIQPLRSSVEFAALFQLRSSLGLRSRDWPRRGEPCSSWTGVQCRQGRVVSINVSGLRRTRLGRFNPQFSVDALVNFTLLESFNSSAFALPGFIPNWFGLQLTMLRVLDLGSSSVTGDIPLTLGNLTRLTTLVLSNNNLTGSIPSTLGQLLLLNALDLSGNLLTGSIPTSLSSLNNLSFLDISSNSLVGPIPAIIGTLFNLQSLNLSHNSLSSSVPARLADLARLIDLDISSNSLSGHLPAEWRGLRSLQKLDTSDNNFAGTLPSNFFSSLSSLQYITLNHNNFSGELPGDLWGMRGLLSLDISGNSLTGTLPDLNTTGRVTDGAFNASRNLLYGSLTDVISRFGVADLSVNFLQGPVPVRLRNSTLFELNCLQRVTGQRSAEECRSFYAARNLSFDDFGNYSSTPVPSANGNENRRTLILLIGILGGSILLVLVLVLLVLLFICCRHRSGHRGNGVGPVPAHAGSQSPGAAINLASLGEAFTYGQLLLATDEFSSSNLIKNGHSGDLFRGVLENGVTVIVKRVDVQSLKKDAYLSELELFSKVSHPRLVPLIGNCLENENHKFLVYKYMSNGDLSGSLHRKTDSDVSASLQSLDWITRLKIATGAAEALSYLHHECTPPLVHRDVQASSILLDDKFDVRLGSMSDVCAQEGDVRQSRITRFLRFQQAPDQGTSGSGSGCGWWYDVYCFGKVLLEVITGKVGGETGSGTKEWIEKTVSYINAYDRGLVTKIIDPSLIVDEDLLEEVWAMAIVARSCLNPRPKKRPLMKYVLKALENPLKVVREDHNHSHHSGTARLRTVSSTGSWNAALFGSWRRSSSDAPPAPTRGEGASGSKEHHQQQQSGDDVIDEDDVELG